MLTGALLTISVMLALLTGIIWFFATSGVLYEREMLRFAPAEVTGLPENEYSAMARHIADYLAGRKDSFQYILNGSDGENIACFHEYELIHMADCRGLIKLDGMVCILCCIMATGTLILLISRRKRGLREAIRGAKTALWAWGIVAAVLVLWAVINFDGLFITFHRIVFRNDYWLLNPRTDLLIRLMPEAMFVDMGIRGLAIFLALESAFLVLLIRMERRK